MPAYSSQNTHASIFTCAYSYSHTHTCILILAYSYLHTHTQIYKLAYSYTHMHTHIIILILAYSNLHSHNCILILAYLYLHSHIHILILKLPYSYSYSHPCILILAQAYLHTNIFTYSYSYTQILTQLTHTFKKIVNYPSCHMTDLVPFYVQELSEMTIMVKGLHSSCSFKGSFNESLYIEGIIPSYQGIKTSPPVTG